MHGLAQELVAQVTFLGSESQAEAAEAVNAGLQPGENRRQNNRYYR
jgi:hypothetical protein